MMAAARIRPDRPSPAGATVGSRASDPDIVVASGRIHATYKGTIDLFDHLREPLVERVPSDDPICRSFEELLEEIRANRPGGRAMAEALLRRCLILLLRRYWEHGERRPSWLAAFDDARLGRAIAAMQDRPEQSFTLPTLAEVASMSRSVFAARFAEVLSQPPIEFLKSVRLARAAHLLTRTDLPVKVVASRVGYASRSSFTRAFVARHGLGPLAFRAAAGREDAPRAWPVGVLGDARRGR
jgi:AraC family transcriptional regulator, activator of mtrCDE